VKSQGGESERAKGEVLKVR